MSEHAISVPDERPQIIYSTPWMTVIERKISGLQEPFAFVTRRDFVVVVCSTPRGLVLVEQWRHAVNEWLWELPQGAQEAGESATDAALRELREETGWVGVDPCVALPQLYEAADWATQSFTVVTCGAGDNAGSDLEAGEQIRRSREVTLDNLAYLVRTGQIKDAATLAALAVTGSFGSGVRSR